MGVFDSGLGGLTILRGLLSSVPDCTYLYLGDTARTPYGNRSFDSILKFTQEAVDYLFKQNCQVVLLACNTASAKALRTLQQNYLPKNFPERRILGVIRPSAEALASQFSSPATVAVWGTTGTIRSDSYALELKKLAPHLSLIQQACPLLVPLIEAQEDKTPGCQFFIEKYWQETLLQNQNIKALLLGCTHYPLLKEEIQKITGPGVKILDQGEIIGKSWKTYLSRHPEHRDKLDKTSQFQLQTTDRPQLFEELAQRILLSSPHTSTQTIELPTQHP